MGVAYSSGTQELHVQFNSGTEYTYEDVPEEEFAALRDAPSPGAYLNENIKDVYSYRRG